MEQCDSSERDRERESKVCSVKSGEEEVSDRRRERGKARKEWRRGGVDRSSQGEN